MLLNSNSFNFGFFLGGKTIVDSLESGAMRYGGATQKENTIYSNVETDSNIIINDKGNRLGIFIPSTIQADIQVDSQQYVQKT